MSPQIHTIEHPRFKILWTTLLPLRRILPQHTENNPRAVEQFAVRRLIQHEFEGEVNLTYSPEGRPYLCPAINRADAHCPPISISHGAGIATLAVSKSPLPVGIDIEGHRRQLLRVYTRFLRPEEYPEEITVDTLLPLWTMKEAAWKAMPSQPPSLIDVPLHRFAFYHYHILPHTLLTVATPKQNSSDT